MKRIESIKRGWWKGQTFKDRNYKHAGPGYLNDDYSDRKVGRLYNDLNLNIKGSQINKGEILFLHDFVKKIGGGNIANLGCYRGASAGAMAYALNKSEFGPAYPGRIYTVDVYRGSNEKLAARYFNTLGVSDLVEVCVGQTNIWATRFEKEFFNFVFIDAGHDYAACKFDVDLWNPLVKVGGFVGFHDVHLDSVNQVIEELDKDRWELVEHCLLIKVFRKGMEV